MLSTNRSRPIIDVVPAHYRSAAMDDLNPSLRAKLGSSGWVVLSGGVGRGKTYAMAALCNAQGENGWIEWPEFLTDVKRHWDLKTADATDFDPLRWACTFNGTLFLDDVGAEAKDFGVERFQQIVNARYSRDLRMIITTNYTVKELSIRYGERAISRLCELATWITLSGPDLRTEKRKAIAV